MRYLTPGKDAGYKNGAHVDPATVLNQRRYTYEGECDQQSARIRARWERLRRLRVFALGSGVDTRALRSPSSVGAGERFSGVAQGAPARGGGGHGAQSAAQGRLSALNVTATCTVTEAGHNDRTGAHGTVEPPTRSVPSLRYTHRRQVTHGGRQPALRSMPAAPWHAPARRALRHHGRQRTQIQYLTQNTNIDPTTGAQTYGPASALLGSVLSAPLAGGTRSGGVPWDVRGPEQSRPRCRQWLLLTRRSTQTRTDHPD